MARGRFRSHRPKSLCLDGTCIWSHVAVGARCVPEFRTPLLTCGRPGLTRPVMNTHRALVLASLAALFAFGCGQEAAPPADSPDPGAARASGMSWEEFL